MGENKTGLSEIQIHIMEREITLEEVFPRNDKKTPQSSE